MRDIKKWKVENQHQLALMIQLKNVLLLQSSVLKSDTVNVITLLILFDKIATFLRAAQIAVK